MSPRTCIQCPKTNIKGRGLCEGCYRLARYNGTLGNYTLGRPESRADEVMKLRAAGMTYQQIADTIGGTTKVAVEMVYRRARGKVAPFSVWEKMYVAPAPDTIACPPLSPLFDITPIPGVGVVVDRSRGRHLAHELAQQVDAALGYCADCPLATRAWCVESARPKESGASMVAGGVVWAQGRPVWTLEDQRRANAEWDVAS